MIHTKRCSMRLTAKMRLLSMMLIATSLAGCATQGFDAQKGAAQFVAMSASNAQRVGFTEERQIEILKSFNCSNIRKVRMSWAIQPTQGDSCNVFGQIIPRVLVNVTPVSLIFSGWGDKRGQPTQAGQIAYDVLKSREQELASIVFQGKAKGVLSGNTYCYPGHYLCAIDLDPKFD